MKKLLVTVLLGVGLGLFSGCSVDRHNHSEYAPRGGNLLGIIQTEPNAFAQEPTASLTVNGDELLDRKNVTGNQTKLFWGLITLSDN